VADADVISVFWDVMMCHTLVHELGREQPKTTKELLDIATRHASGEEAVGAAFILGNVKVAASNDRAAPSKATVKGTRKGAKGGEKGHKRQPWRIAVVASDDCNNEKVDDSGEEYVAAAERDFKRQTW
jgi:hypothetical protein